MKVKKIGNWISVLAHIGIVVGLIVAAVQVQENTNTSRAELIQEATELAREQLMAVAQDAELARLVATEFSELSESDQQRRASLARSYWIGMQNLFRLWELDVLPDEDWEVWYGIICDARTRAAPEIWSRQADLHADFLQAVEDCMGK